MKGLRRTRIIRGYKFLQQDLTSRNDPKHVKWVVKEWRKHSGPLEMCQAGFHASETPLDSLNYVYGDRWFKIEAKGKLLKDSGKFVAEQMRLVKELPTKLITVRFAVACARHTLDKFEVKYPEDKRPREALDAAEAWVKDPSEANRSAAWSAARSAASAAESAAWSAASAAESAAWSAASAAESAAWSAAESAAWSAASAARSAARSAASAAESAAWSAASAARSAARETEVAWQRKTLLKIVDEEAA